MKLVGPDDLVRIQHEIVVGHMAEPQDQGFGILYLASDESKYVTGTELIIDGGYTCH